MKSVDTAGMKAGYGIEGDRHSVSEGVRTARQVLLMDEETLGKFGLESGQVRENITTSGIDLHTIEAGQQVALGDTAVVEITGFCAPCARMDEIRDGLRVELDEQRGMLATVIQSGAIAVGDSVKAQEGAAV
jgi:MOSC domain-containing protein YiiM